MCKTGFTEATTDANSPVYNHDYSQISYQKKKKKKVLDLIAQKLGQGKEVSVEGSFMASSSFSNAS